MILMTVPCDRIASHILEVSIDFNNSYAFIFLYVSSQHINRIFVNHARLSLALFVHNFHRIIQELRTPSSDNVITYQIAIHFHYSCIDALAVCPNAVK